MTEKSLHMAPERNNRKSKSFLASAALRLLSAVFFYVVLAFAAAALLVTWTKLSSHGDPSASASASWVLLMLRPYFPLFNTLASLVVGAVVASKLNHDKHQTWLYGFFIFIGILMAVDSISAGNAFWRIRAVIQSRNNDVATKIAQLNQSSGAPSSGLVFSPDGGLLAVTGPDSTIEIWDWKRRRVVQKMQIQGANLGLIANPLQFSPDGNLFAACVERLADDTMVRVWNTRTWAVEFSAKISGEGACSGVGFSRDSKTVVASIHRVYTGGPNLYLYSTDTWREVSNFSYDETVPAIISVNPMDDIVAVGGMFFPKTPDQGGGSALSGSKVATINFRENKILKIMSIPVSDGLAWSSDGKRIVASGGDLITILSSDTGEEIVKNRVDSPSHIISDFTPDGRYVIACSWTGLFGGFGVQIWDSQMKKLLQTIHGQTTSIAITNDSRYLAIKEPGRISVWEFK